MEMDSHMSQLHLLCSSLTQKESSQAVDTLLKIVQNAVENPGVEQYRRIRTSNKAFNTRVWRHSGAREFLATTGWVEVDDMIVLFSDDLLQMALLALTKCTSLLETQSVQSSSAVVHEDVKSEPSSASTANQTEQREKLRQLLRKQEEEKKRIAEQIKADRKETSNREAKPSHGKQLKFGTKLNRFEDIGVDLNAGGG